MHQEAINESRRLDEEGRARDAVAVLSDAIETDPCGELYFERGCLHESLEDFSSAFDDYEAATGLAKNVMRYWVAIGRLLHSKMGEPGSAVAYYRVAILRDPTSAIPHQDICIAYISTECFEAAWNHAEIARELAPTDSMTHYCLGQCHVTRGEYLEAMQQFQEAVSIDDGRYSYWLALGDSNYRLGNIDESRRNFERALEINKSVIAFVGLAKSFINMKEPAKAIENLNDARALVSGEVDEVLVDAHLKRAQLLL